MKGDMSLSQYILTPQNLPGGSQGAPDPQSITLSPVLTSLIDSEIFVDLHDYIERDVDVVTGGNF